MKNRSNLIRLHWNSANVTQGAHIHQPTARPVRHACAQPYHATSDSHRQLFRPCWVPPTCQSCWVNEQGRGKPHIAEVCAKRSIKRQLHTTHVGAVGWEPHSSSTTTCAGKVDHELPVKARGTHTPTHGLAITSRMSTAISRGWWQPWTPVSTLLGLISMA